MDHQVAVGVGQKPLVAGRLRELALEQPHHKHGVGLGQAHTARRCQNDAVQALRDVPHVGGAQKQGEQLGVVGGGEHLVLQQQGQLVEQGHDDVPLAQHLIGFGQAALRAQRFSQRVQGVLGSQRLQKQVELFGQRGGPGVFGAGQKVGDTLHQKGAGGFGVLQGLSVLRVVGARVPSGTAGERCAPVSRAQRPGVGVVFQRALLRFGQVDQPGLEQPQQTAAGDTAAG